MTPTVADILKILPRTNCGQCGFPSCMALALFALKNGTPLGKCPHLLPDAKRIVSVLKSRQQTGEGSIREAVAASVAAMQKKIAPLDFAAIAPGIGAVYDEEGGAPCLRLNYFGKPVRVFKDHIAHSTDIPLDSWDDVFLYNYVFSRGNEPLTGRWITFNELSSCLRDTVALNLTGQNTFPWPEDDCMNLCARAMTHGAQPTGMETAADAALVFRPVAMAPVALLCYKAEPEDGLEARLQFLFDANVGAYLDYEGAFFLTKRIRELLADG
jgi:hypothetical protein